VNTPFHDGELEMQARVGMRERLASGAARFIRDHMPDQHREFFAELPFVLAGTLDAAGRPWATLLAGAPGFVSSPDANHLQLQVHPAGPAADSFRVGAAIGLLGIQLHTQRRNRANGRIVASRAGELRVEVQQSFGNCPKYINIREAGFAVDAAVDAAGAREGAALSPRARELVARADTLFIASASRDQSPGDRAAGCDVSHRGGAPGFVQIRGESELWIPDYRGNNFFNTYGNILQRPVAGLLIPDFTSGDALMLTGSAEVVGEQESRGLRFRSLSGWWRQPSLPYHSA
jgi:predicted pyridoxine 5'-phosphate oxidase superfamily flavin-nucleotide-binding protein